MYNMLDYSLASKADSISQLGPQEYAKRIKIQCGCLQGWDYCFEKGTKSSKI
jgi:hypothetical protein